MIARSTRADASASQLPHLDKMHTASGPDTIAVVKTAALLMLAQTSSAYAGAVRSTASRDALERPFGAAQPHPTAMHARTLLDAGAPKKRELVVARWHDDLSWVEKVPAHWNVTVYNGGEDDLSTSEARPFTKVNFSSNGESHVIAHHLGTAYRDLADCTVFAHDNPFEHSPGFMQLLSGDATCVNGVQTMSLRRDEHLPTAGVLQKFTSAEQTRSERMSLRTGSSLYYHDYEAAKGRTYRDHYDLHEGTNLVADYLTGVGLPGWVSESQDVGSYAHGSMFAVDKKKVLQHPQTVYQMMEIKNAHTEVDGPIAEKSWLMVFGGGIFNDHPLPKPEAEPKPSIA